MAEESLVIKLRVKGEAIAIQELDGQSRICNWLYNHLLEKSLGLKKDFIQTASEQASKTLYTKRGLRNEVPKLKEIHPFLKVVHSSPLKNTALRLSEAIQAHQKFKKGREKAVE
jgi:putative transposase